MITRQLLKTFFVIGIALALSVLGCSRDNHDHPALITGEQLYTHHCAECHGEDGTGKLFDSLPANILTQKSPPEIVAYILTPIQHQRQMPTFKSMPPAEAELITAHLLKLKADYEEGIRSKPKQLLIDPVVIEPN